MSGPAAPEGFRRAIGFADAALLVAGAMVGSGIFVTPSFVACDARNATEFAAVWVAGGLLSLAGAWVFSRATPVLGETAGLYRLLERAFGPGMAAAFGWTMVLVLVPSSLAAFARFGAAHLLHLFGATETETRLRMGAGLIVAGIAALSLVSSGVGARLHGLGMLFRWAGAALLAVLAWRLGGASRLDAGARSMVDAVAPHTWMAAIVPALWAYDGWIDLTSIAGEVRDPTRTVPRALLVGTAGVTLGYLALAGGLFHALGATDLCHDATPAVTVALRALGPVGAHVAGVVVTASILGACHAGFFTGTRVAHAAWVDVWRPRGDVRTDAPGPRFLRPNAHGVPVASVVVCALAGLVYVLTPAMDLANAFVLGAWPFYAAGALGVARLERRQGLALCGVAVVFAVSSLAVCVQGFAQSFRGGAVSVGFVLALGLAGVLHRRGRGRLRA